MGIKESGTSFLDFLSRYSKRIMIVLGSLAVLSVLAGGGLWYYYKVMNKDVLAMIGNEKITQKDLNAFIYSITMGGTPESPDLTDYKGVPNSQFLDMYIESKLLEKDSVKSGIVVSESEIDSMMAEKFPWMDKNNILLPVVRNYQLYLARKSKMASKVLGEKEGYWIMARNDMSLPDRGTDPTVEQSKKIAENKVYSEKFIKDVYAKLKAGTITIEEAVKLENNDPIIGKTAPSANTGLHSMFFDSEMFKERSGLLGDQNILNSVKTLKAGEYTEPVHLINDDGTDIGWYIIYISKSTKDPTGLTYDEWLKNVYDEYKVVIYQEAR